MIRLAWAAVLLAMSYFAHSFESVISTWDLGRMIYRIIAVPEDLVSTLPRSGNQPPRIAGEINDFPYSGAISRNSDGPYLLISARALKATGLRTGDPVEVRFNLEAPDAVAVPELLGDALAEDAAARAGWNALTPGRQRALSYHVGSAKRAETQAKRAAEIVAGLKGLDGMTLPGSPSRRGTSR